MYHSLPTMTDAAEKKKKFESKAPLLSVHTEITFLHKQFREQKFTAYITGKITV